MASRTQIDWLEEWVSPGLCLLARLEMGSLASLGAVERQRSAASGIWACVHEDEMALIDAPFPWEDADETLALVDGFIARHRVRLKYVAATQLDASRAGGLVATLNHYRYSTFVYPLSWQTHWKNLSLDRQQLGFQQGLSKQWDNPRHQSFEDCLETQLAGERLFFVDAPYRTLTDQLVVFRGTALHAGWELPGSFQEPLPEHSLPEAALQDTLTRLADFEGRHRYVIRSSVDVEGTTRRNDFQRRSLMAYLRMVQGVDSDLSANG